MFTTRLPVAVAVLAVAACGSGPARRPSPAAIQHDMVAFSACMRTHGAPGFPDPSSPRAFKTALGRATPALASARTACRHLLPPGGQSGAATAQHPERVPGELAFARCLRRRGFPRFPDPTAGGELSHEMLAAAGIDSHSPALVRAADACVGVTRGTITRADVARFAAGR